MDLLAYLNTQVHANRLANHRLHRALRTLSREEFEAERTGFFPSLQKTLRHILAVDLYYLAALHGEADMERQWREAPACQTVGELASAQAAADQRFIAHVSGLAPEALDETIALDRGAGRVQRELRGHVIAHLLNHQVHHRGQAHAMLSGTVVAPPQLDEFLMPSEAHLREADLKALGWTEAFLFPVPAQGA
jgi:uncharacterized damage-inducible protein DinB